MLKIVRLDSKKTALEKEQTDTQNKLFEEYKLTRREAEALDINLENIPEAKRELYDVKSKIKSLGNVNVSAIEEYKEKVAPALEEKFNYTSSMQIPKIDKIVLNMGVGDAVSNAKNSDEAVEELTLISGQKPLITKAKK